MYQFPFCCSNLTNKRITLKIISIYVYIHNLYFVKHSHLTDNIYLIRALYFVVNLINEGYASLMSFRHIQGEEGKDKQIEKENFVFVYSPDSLIKHRICYTVEQANIPRGFFTIANFRG